MMKNIFKMWIDLTLILTSILFLFSCGTAGGNASPIPPEEIPLSGSMGSIIDIPYASNPIMSTSREEISSSTDSIVNLQYFQNDDGDYNLGNIFDSNTSEAACVHSWFVAKAVNNSGDADNVLCVLKKAQGSLENEIPNLYDGNAHVITFPYDGGMQKVKIKFDGERSSNNTLTNITSFTVHSCRGSSESDLAQESYAQYIRSANDGTIDNLQVTNIHFDADDNSTIMSEITTYSNASLDLVESKSIDLQYYNPWQEGDGGMEFGRASIDIGYSNVQVNGFARYTSLQVGNEADRIWQLDSVGAFIISDYENYNIKEDTSVGDASANFIIDQGTQSEVCFNSSTTQAVSCPSTFSNSSNLGAVPSYETISTISTTDEQTWDCSDTATTVDLSSFLEDIIADCAPYTDIQATATMDCNYLWD